MQDSSTLHQAALALVQVSWPALEQQTLLCHTSRSQAEGVQVPSCSWLSLNKRDDLSRILSAGGWGDLCPGDTVHLMTTQPPSPSPAALSDSVSSPTSPLSSTTSNPALPLPPPPPPSPPPSSDPPATSAPALSSIAAPVPTTPAPATVSPTFHVLQSLALALAQPATHIRVLRDGSAAVGGGSAQGFSAVASIVGAAVCVLVSSAGGCCCAQLPLISTTADSSDAGGGRAREEAWKQVTLAAANPSRPLLTLPFPSAAVAASASCRQSKLHQRGRSCRPCSSGPSRE